MTPSSRVLPEFGAKIILARLDKDGRRIVHGPVVEGLGTDWQRWTHWEYAE